MANQSFLEHLGYSVDEVTGHPLEKFVVDDERGRLAAVLKRVAHKSKKTERIELCCKDLDGTPAHCSYTFRRSNDGQHILAAGRNLDAWHQSCNEMCKEYHALEGIIGERTRDLRLANAELEAFNFSISHDLRAPLRAINGFSMALTEDYGNRLDDAGRDYLRRIRVNCERMSTLTGYLLQLSRLSRQELSCISVDMGPMADTIIADLRAAEPRRDVFFSRNGDLVVQGDRELLFLLVQNLLENAWKYTSCREMAEIRFSSSDVNGERVFSVVDNGIGFPNSQRDKLFMLFHRLHSPDEYEGLGVGLATAQRVVQRHDGRIWAESCIREGSAFYFTLNKKVTSSLAPNAHQE